jgi:hypothetical protein
MKEHPILFSGEMVRAILDGRKTQTRRIVRPPPDSKTAGFGRCPYGVPGDRLWVRETHAWADEFCEDVERDPPNIVAYKADGTFRRFWTDPSNGNPKSHEYDFGDANLDHPDLRWRPSIFMPRWASRLTLQVEEVRVERVQDITEDDVEAEGVWSARDCSDNCKRTGGEGCRNCCIDLIRDRWIPLWDRINAKRGFPWSSNCFVWVVTFRRVG